MIVIAELETDIAVTKTSAPDFAQQIPVTPTPTPTHPHPPTLYPIVYSEKN